MYIHISGWRCLQMAPKPIAPFHYDEITLMGDKSGVEAGIIATQLWNKLAISATIGHTQVLDKSRNDKVIYVPERSYQSMNYSLSAGYLLIPREYTDYRQLNINLYLEILAQQSLDIPRHYVDFGPAVQFIFNSNTKLNIGYRFQVAGTCNACPPIAGKSALNGHFSMRWATNEASASA